MHDFSKILDAVKNLGSKHAVLATIVRSQGFPHGKPGTRYLIHEDGSIVGSLGAGSLSHEIAERSLSLLGGQQTILAVFDATGTAGEFREHAHKDQGVLTILLEPMTPASFLQFDLIRDVYESKTEGVIATITRVQGELKVGAGSRVFLAPTGIVRETVNNPFVTAAIVAEAERHGSSSSTTIRFTEGSVDVFLELVQPPNLSGIDV